MDLAGFGAGDVTLGSVASLADHIASSGLLHVDRSRANVTVTLTSHGADTAKQEAARREDRNLREKTLRNNMIVWLAKHEAETDEPCDWHDLLLDPAATFADDVFTIREMRREARYLADEDLIRATPDPSGTDAGWTKPCLTAKGRGCNAEFGGDVAKSLKPDDPSNRPTYYVKTEGDNNQVNFGNDATQTAYAPAPNAQAAVSEPAPEPAAPASAPTTASAPGKKGRWAKVRSVVTSVWGIVIGVAIIATAVAACWPLFH